MIQQPYSVHDDAEVVPTTPRLVRLFHLYRSARLAIFCRGVWPGVGWLRHSGLGQPQGTILNLDGFFGGDKQVTIRKKGFEPESRMIFHHQDFFTAKWVDGSTNFWFLTAPLFWTFGDFFLPFGTRWTYTPHELHVRLYPEGEAPGTGK